MIYEKELELSDGSKDLGAADLKHGVMFTNRMKCRNLYQLIFVEMGAEERLFSPSETKETCSFSGSFFFQVTAMSFQPEFCMICR